ncbi:transposable element Tcb2 transposase [Trichonephila clavipes]|nr:transposable element Tcb2 transposase [Trichonephila clavipes]
MNPIEHVWDALRSRVADRQPPPQTLQELENALLEEWDRIPQLVINSLIDSMPQRFEDGFSHVPLDEVSSEICTFNTPFGRYKFNKMPFGIVLHRGISEKKSKSFWRY